MAQLSIQKVVKANGLIHFFFDDGNVFTFDSLAQLRDFAQQFGRSPLHAFLILSLVARALDDATPAQLAGRSISIDLTSLSPVTVT